MLVNQDLMECQFNLINDAVIFVNTTSTVTKINKSAEILLNTSASTAVGKQVAELLGSDNSQFF